jgi:hypothetical protein
MQCALWHGGTGCFGNEPAAVCHNAWVCVNIAHVEQVAAHQYSMKLLSSIDVYTSKERVCPPELPAPHPAHPGGPPLLPCSQPGLLLMAPPDQGAGQPADVETGRQVGYQL